MSAKIEGIEEITKAMQNVALHIGDVKTKRHVLRRAAIIVRDAARSIAPRNKTRKVSYRYNTPKISGKLRAPKGMGVKIAEYLRGNLAGAITVFTFRKIAGAIIGPKVSKRGSGSGRFGPGTRRFDAYYAQFIFGSAKAFQRQVMIKALQQTSGQVVDSIEKGVRTELEKVARKNGIDVR